MGRSLLGGRSEAWFFGAKQKGDALARLESNRIERLSCWIGCQRDRAKTLLMQRFKSVGELGQSGMRYGEHGTH